VNVELTPSATDRVLKVYRYLFVSLAKERYRYLGTLSVIK
jgi:hypothetical protein